MKLIKSYHLTFLFFLALMLFTNYQIIESYSEGFSLKGPTHCFSVGEGYDSKFLFSIQSLGYVGQVNFEVNAATGIIVELNTPIFLNSSESRTYCPITVKATSEAPRGNQSIMIIARGGSFSDSISICIIVSSFTNLIIQTTPESIPVEIFLDNTKYILENQPFTLQTRTGKHTIELITNSTFRGSKRLVSNGLDISNSAGEVTHYENKSLTFEIIGRSTITILFKEEGEPINGKFELVKLISSMSQSIILSLIIIIVMVVVFIFFKKKAQTKINFNILIN